MFDDDNAARRALGTLNDEPAPPAVTTVDQVLRRGRRRVFVQRAGAVAGVVAVVAAIGVTAVLLRPEGEHGNGVQVADSATPTSPAPAGPLPGWDVVEIDEATCRQNPTLEVLGTPPVTLLPQNVVESAVTTAVEDVLGQVPMTVSRTFEEYSPKANGPRGYVEVEVGMDNGNGQLQLEAYVYGGTPLQTANASLYSYGDCNPPARHVLDDGTVLQLFQPDKSPPEQPLQHLQIFRPDGRGYVLTAAGYSYADMEPVKGGAYTIEGGRGKLPTTEPQLTRIGTNLAKALN